MADRQNDRFHLEFGSQEIIQYQKKEAKHNKNYTIIGILAIALFFLFIGSLLLVVPYNNYLFTPSWVTSHVQMRFSQMYQFLFGHDADFFGITIWQYCAVMVVGASLAATGAVFQGSLRNVIAGPSTMGVMSGGTLGCLAYLLLFTSGTPLIVNTEADMAAYYSRSLFQIYSKQLCVLIGCFAAVMLVLLVATIAGRGRVSATAMILSGTVLSTLSGNLVMVIQYYILLKNPEDTRIEAISDMMMGSFNDITNLRTLLLMAVPMLLCMVMLLLLSGKLNLLSLGEEEALTMGVNVPFYRNLMIAAGTVLTAMVVAFCGRIGFLGFMIPLVARKITGPDMRRLLPVSMLVGAILLVIVYDAAYIAGLSDYLNLFTSSIGCIVMVITLFVRKGGKNHAA